MSACKGGAGDRFCCFYWVREAPEGFFFSALRFTAERHPDRNSGDLSGFTGGIYEGHQSCCLEERLLPISKSPSTRGSDSALVSALPQGVLGSQGTGSSAIPCGISQMK